MHANIYLLRTSQRILLSLRSIHHHHQSCTMADPFAPNLYQQQYEEAVGLFDKGEFEACIKLAKYNVT
jgi:hypothetical protein